MVCVALISAACFASHVVGNYDRQKNICINYQNVLYTKVAPLSKTEVINIKNTFDSDDLFFGRKF